MQELVAYAFKMREKGDNTLYYDLVRAFSQPTKEHWKWFKVLSACSASIKPDMRELVDALFSFEWEHHTDETIIAYLEFLVHLNSSQQNFLLRTLEALVMRLSPKLNTQGAIPENYEKTCNFVHETFKKLLWVVPSSASKLWPILGEYFPHRVNPTEMQKAFLKNLLYIMEYCPVLQEQIMHIIVDRFLQIDVEIKLEDIPDDDPDQQAEQGVFDLEVRGEEANRQDIEDMANKLDALMDLLLAWLTTQQSAGRGEELFGVLLKAFDRLILRTHKSKFTQFILFFIGRVHPLYNEKFLAYLSQKLYDEQETLVARQTCAAYLGSYVGRVKDLSILVLKEVLKVLSVWAGKYLDQFTENSHVLAPDATRHALFYAVVQSICYIFCFKHHILFEFMDHVSRDFVRGLTLDRIVHSPLNPLKLCLPAVTREFARIARRSMPELHLEPLMEKNRVLVLPTKTLLGQDNQIDNYFPFDPYLLRQSSRYFADIYQDWRGSDDALGEGEGSQPGQTPDVEMSEESFGSFDNNEVRVKTRMRNLSFGSNSFTGHGKWLASGSGSRNNSFSDAKMIGTPIHANNSMLLLSGSYERSQFLVEDRFMD